MFLSIGEGMVATDENGLISRINKTALNMLGYEEAELLGKPFLQAIQNTDSLGNTIDPLERPITQAFVTGKTISAKIFMRKKNGELFAALVTVSPILLDNEPTGAIEVFRDITEAEEIDRMKSEFISIASHQLRTPLTAIKTYTHMLNNGFAGELREQQQDFLNIILSSTEHMNSLVDTLLDISKIETGKLQIVPSVISPLKLIQDIVSEFDGLITQKRILLEIKHERVPKEIFVDPILIREIYSNLLSNAIKYSKVGGTIVLSLKRTTGNLVLSVKDNGYGIPHHQKERIFDKFFRATNALALDANGSGLGLYLVKNIAQNLGGDIWFKSKEGVGSTFFFSMPFKPNETRLEA